MKLFRATIQKFPRRAALTAFFLLFALAAVTLSSNVQKTFAGSEIPSATPPAKTRVKPRTKPQAKPSPTPAPPLGPLDFPHSKHQSKCADCHKFPSANWEKVRAKDAFPDVTEYPKHESCLSCHREQFFSGSTPRICSICHTNPSPDDSSRYPFPNPRELFDQSKKAAAHTSDFKVAFPHATHIEIVSEYRPTHNGFFVNARFDDAAAEQSCAVCHQTMKPQGDDPDEYFSKPPEKLGDDFWLKKGTFKTAPVGHSTCFSCHSADTGILPAPDDCATCHKSAPAAKVGDFDSLLATRMGVTEKVMLDVWRSRESSGKFRHEWSSHAEMKCGDCHKTAAIDLLDPKTTKVAISSCNMCHITETSDDGGILNYEIDMRRKDAKFDCVKCHVTYGRSPIPESHLKAVGGK